MPRIEPPALGVLQDFTHLGIVQCDVEGMVLGCNAGTTAMLGFRPVDLVGGHIGRIFTAEDVEAGVPVGEIEAARVAGVSMDERWHRHRDGRRLWLEGQVLRIDGEAGAVEGFLKVFRDRTHRRLTLDDLERAHRRLLVLTRSLAHDTLGPVRRTLLFLDVLQRTSRLDEEDSRTLGDAVQSLVELEEFQKALLRDAGRTEPEHDASDLNEVFEAVVWSLRAVIESSGAVVTRGPLPQVKIPPTKARSLMQNLVENALKYAPSPRVHVSAKPTGPFWLFAVVDDGPGVAEEDVERIFEERVRLDTTQPGTGLGLSLCRDIVASRGGRIWAESRPEGGLAVHFTLPGA